MSSRLGTNFWSSTSEDCVVAGCESASVTVTKPITVTVLDTGGNPQIGVRVYVYNGNTPVGSPKLTDANGQVVFSPPIGSYRFRVINGIITTWSNTVNHISIPPTITYTITINP